MLSGIKKILACHLAVPVLSDISAVKLVRKLKYYSAECSFHKFLPNVYNTEMAITP